MGTPQSTIIHIVRLFELQVGPYYLFLHQIEPYHYEWFREDQAGIGVKTYVWGETIEEALANAYKTWKLNNIRPVHCGFRYTLPERDEVGTNALFCQMALSYASMTGVYFDEELGFNCIVQFASNEARSLWKRRVSQF